MTALVALLLFVAALAGSQPAGDPNMDHVRVVLDTSCSMGRSVDGRPPADPERRAVLAVLLLFDLTHPNLASGGEETFAVYPFDDSWSWAGTQPPEQRTPAIDAATVGDRDALRANLGAIEYDARNTLFSPGIRAAIEDLRDTPGGALDRRVIVVVTDGLPDDEFLDREQARLRDEVLPQLVDAGIRLYFLSFGPAGTAQDADDFFKPIDQGPHAALVSRQSAQTGDDLLEAMTTLFGEAFGYEAQPGVRLPTTAGVALAGRAGQSPSEAMVVAYHDHPAPPDVAVSDPPGTGTPLTQPPEGPKGLEGALDGTTSAYRVLRFQSPPSVSGGHGIDGSVGATVVVLRKSDITLEIEDPSGAAIPSVMGGRTASLNVVARPSAQDTGDTPNLDVQYRVALGGVGEGSPGFLRYHDVGRQADKSFVDNDGRKYPIRAEFPEDPRPSVGRTTLWYPAYVHAWGSIRGVPLATAEPKQVHVYPRVEIVPLPTPLRLTADPAGRESCPEVRLILTQPTDGALPDVGPATLYRLAAYLDRATDLTTGPLEGAVVSLDGFPLEFEGGTGEWSGRERSEWFSRPLKLCVRLGGSTSGGSARLTVRFELLEAPYDAFDVVEPLTVDVVVRPPTWLEKNRAWLALALLATVVAALTRALARRPDLPPDLRVSIATGGAETEVVIAPEPPLFPWRWFGTPRYVVRAAGLGDIGILIPRDGTLFELISRGGSIAPRSADGSGGDLIEAGRPYRISRSEGDVTLRVRYATSSDLPAGGAS